MQPTPHILISARAMSTHSLNQVKVAYLRVGSSDVVVRYLD